MNHTIISFIIFSVLVGVLVFAIWSNNAYTYAQQSSSTSSSSTSPSSSAAAQPPPVSKLQHISKVKITSPTKGQQVPVGKDVTVSGTSMDNATSNNCKVSVIVNKVRPYQPATPAAGAGSSSGSAGATDYSKWNFVLTSKYTTIKPGPNRITAKYECVNNPALTSFSSVNVTGLQAATSASPPSSATNQTNSSSPSPQAPSALGANQTAAKQQQPANNTGRSSNSTANPLADLPVIGKLFGGK